MSEQMSKKENPPEVKIKGGKQEEIIWQSNCLENYDTSCFTNLI